MTGAVPDFSYIGFPRVEKELVSQGLLWEYFTRKSGCITDPVRIGRGVLLGVAQEASETDVLPV